MTVNKRRLGVERGATCADLGNQQNVEYDGGVSNNRAIEPELVDVRGVSAMLACSQRTVWRLSDGGKMPLPIRIGKLVRWRRKDLEEWIQRGCPAGPSRRSMGTTRRGVPR